MSKMSFIGRVGINLMHKDYKFLKTWWKGGLVVYAALLALFLIHTILHRILPLGVARVMHFLLLAAAGYGLYFTYNDFQDDFSHHLLKSNFHLGAYLFWIGWMLVCVFFLSRRKPVKAMNLPKGQL